MYIRINDKDDIAQHDSFFNFLNAKKRKGHQIIKFKIKILKFIKCEILNILYNIYYYIRK